MYDFRGWPTPDDSGLPFSPAVSSGAARIHNGDGVWVGTWDGFGSAVGGQEWIQLQDEGAYEDLTTVIHQTTDPASGDETCEGVIVPGVLPDHPVSVTATAEGDSSEEVPAE